MKSGDGIFPSLRRSLNVESALAISKLRVFKPKWLAGKLSVPPYSTTLMYRFNLTASHSRSQIKSLSHVELVLHCFSPHFILFNSLPMNLKYTLISLYIPLNIVTRLLNSIIRFFGGSVRSSWLSLSIRVMSISKYCPLRCSIAVGVVQNVAENGASGTLPKGP